MFDFQDEEQLPPAAEAPSPGLADAPASPDSEAAAGGAPSLLPRAPPPKFISQTSTQTAIQVVRDVSTFGPNSVIVIVPRPSVRST